MVKTIPGPAPIAEKAKDLKPSKYPRTAHQGEKLRKEYTKPRRVTTEYLLIHARQAISELYGDKVGAEWDPVVDLCVIGANPSADPAIRIAALSKAAPYFHSPARPVISDDDKPKNLDAEQIMRRVAAQLLGSPDSKDKITGEPEPEAKFNEK